MARVSELMGSLSAHSVATVLLACMVVVFAEPSSFDAFWKHEFPSTAMPQALEKLASPLSPSSSQLYLTQLKAGTLQASNKQFCSSAKIYCPQKAFIPVRGPQPRVCIPPFFNYEYGILPCRNGASAVSAVQDSGIFFTQGDLVQGQAVIIPDTSNDLKGFTFLPASLADALPFDSHHIPELESFYGVAKGSDMELDMEDTLAHCSYMSKHEVRGCQTSGEGVVSFVTNTIGHDAIVYTPTAITKQNAMVMGISMVATQGHKVASCHDMKFPSMVYSCHMTQTAQFIDVTLKLANGNIAQGLAVCHMDTSYWNPSHIAFQALNVEPGKSAICHWFPENSFIFVQGKGM